MADKFDPPALSEFIALTNSRNFARVNRFAVEFNVPRGLAGSEYANQARDLTLLCEEASLPGKQIMPRTLRINALSEPRAHTIDWWNDTASFQFLIDNDFTARSFFEDWLSLCTGNHITREVGDYDQYIADITVHCLAPIPSGPILEGERGPAEKIIWSIQLLEAWPRSIVIAPVSYSNTSIHRMVLTLMYKSWVSVDGQGAAKSDEEISRAAITEQLDDNIRRASSLLGGIDFF